MDDNNGVRIPQPEEYGEHIARLNAESIHQKQQIAWQSKQIERLEHNYQALTTQQSETKTLVGGLYTRFEGLDSRLFGMVQQMTKDNAQLLQQVTKGQAHERHESDLERSTTQKSWMGLTKYVISVTIAALITYIFTRGLI